MFNKLLIQLLELSRVQKRIIQIITDASLIAASYTFAMALRLEGFSFIEDLEVWLALVIIIPASILVFMRLGFYRAVIRYISTKATETIVIGIAFSALVLFAASQIMGLPVPRSVPAIYALLALFSIGGVRFFLRTLLSKQRLRAKENIIIYGAGESGRQLLNALKQGPEYSAVAFIDDDQFNTGQDLGGVVVFGPDRLPELIKRFGVKTVLLALPSASRTAKRTIVERLEGLFVAVRTIPGMADLVSGRASVNDLKVVEVEDLLGRDPVPPQKELLNRNIFGKSVLVSGGGGSIGSELCRQIIKQKPSTLVVFDISEFSLYLIESELVQMAKMLDSNVRILPILGSVQNPQRIELILKTFNVDTVYHAAAYKHVPLVEQNVVEGLRNNIFGTKSIADAAISAGVQDFILISTDKAVRPSNFMGASKRIAELVCQSFSKSQTRTRFSMVRFGNVLGSSGSVIPRFKEQIAKGGPVTVTHPEITRFFMTIPEAALLVIQAGAMAKGGDVFVLDMGDPVPIVDLARRMIALHGLQEFFPGDNSFEPKSGDIAIEFTGLRSGEKLYEELLVGNNPSGTGHPRIMTANEVDLPTAELENLLTEILNASIHQDISQIRELLLSCLIEFRPTDEPSDLIESIDDSPLKAT